MSTETAIYLVALVTLIGGAVGVWLYLDRKL
jgi:hypothetical protein